MVAVAGASSACGLIDPPGNGSTASDQPAIDKPASLQGDNPMEAEALPTLKQLEAEKAAARAARGPTDRNAPLSGWSVSLVSNGDWRQWPGHSVGLIATANQDVGPTPWYLTIVETDWLGSRIVAICGAGSTCTANATSPSSIRRSYIAYVGAYASTPPIPNQQAVSNTAWILWDNPSYMDLHSNRGTFPPGASATLSATVDIDIGPSPWYISIVDTSTGTLVGVCGSGKTCTATASQTLPGTHTYAAYLGGYPSVLPITGSLLLSAQSYVTWATSGYVVDLQYDTSGGGAVIATANVDVGPTPYYITILDAYTGALLTYCGSGSSCTLNATASTYCTQLVAFVSSVGSLPPPNIQANSQTFLHVCIN